MYKGVVLLASNTISCDGKLLDYVGLARFNARLIKRNLKLPVALITTDDIDTCGFDEVIKISNGKSANRSMLAYDEIITYEWKNDGRIDAFRYSPWDRTLLLDADYLVMTDQLLPLLSSDVDFMIADSVYDVTGRAVWKNSRLMPNKTIKQRWATVMCFDKSAGYVFDAAKMIRENYDYYAASFGFTINPLRNDYVFSIAAELLGLRGLPFDIFMSPADVKLTTIDEQGMRLEHGGNLMRWSGDLHVMNKELIYDAPSFEDYI